MSKNYLSLLFLCCFGTFSFGQNTLSKGDHFANINGIRIHYFVRGKGPVCLLPSPGWGPSIGYLKSTLQPLENYFTIVYYDTRMSEQSEGSADTTKYTSKDFMEDLDALRVYLHQKKIWLMGHSAGGFQVLYYSIHHNDKLNGIIVLDGIAGEDSLRMTELMKIVSKRKGLPYYQKGVDVITGKDTTNYSIIEATRIILPFYFHDSTKMKEFLKLGVTQMSEKETGDIISPDIYYSALMAGPIFFSDPRTSAATKGGVSGKMPYMLAVTDSTNMILAIAEAKGTGATGIKLYANLSASLVNKIVAEAKRQRMIVWAHAWLQDAKPSDVVKAGVSPVSHSPLLLYDKLDSVPTYWKNGHTHYNSIGDSVPDLSSLFRLMREHHTILDATMLAYKSWADEDSTMRYDYEITKRITAQAYKAGVTIDAGTDDDQKEFVQKEMELLVKDAGFTPIDAIIAATLNSAKALQIDNSHGTISNGKIANLLILDKNPLENIENIYSVYLVIKNGVLFKR